MALHSGSGLAPAPSYLIAARGRKPKSTISKSVPGTGFEPARPARIRVIQLPRVYRFRHPGSGRRRSNRRRLFFRLLFQKPTPIAFLYPTALIQPREGSTARAVHRLPVGAGNLDDDDADDLSTPKAGPFCDDVVYDVDDRWIVPWRLDWEALQPARRAPEPGAASPHPAPPPGYGQPRPSSPSGTPSLPERQRPPGCRQNQPCPTF